MNDELTSQVIGSAIEVHRALGPGLLESAYEACLCHELRLRQIPFARQRAVDVQYKGTAVDCGYRIDLLIDDRLVVEVKAVERLLPIHKAQLISYLKLGGWPVGLLINFNVQQLRHGIQRCVNSLAT